MTERVMRASDQDREEAIRALSDHFADGRLDHVEFESRMERAQEATYVHDLDPLFADLPARRLETVLPRVPERRPRPRASFVPFLVLAGLMALVLTQAHAAWLLIPLWFVGFSVARRLAWRRHAWAHAALPEGHGSQGGGRAHGIRRP